MPIKWVQHQYFDIESGKSYALNMMEPNAVALDPNTRFKFEVISDSLELVTFLKEKFFGFQPFKEWDKEMFEEQSNPLIQY